MALVSCVGASLLLSGCGSVDTSTNRLLTAVSPYRLEVVQGNFVSKEQVAALKPGMSRNQVRDILGTSLLASIFHSNRWDYVFTLHRQGVDTQSRRLSVFFEGDAMTRFEGDDMPSETEFVAQLESNRKLGKVPVLQVDPDSLKPFAPKQVPPAASTTPGAPAAVSNTYPPLEGASL
jgi:outer membrane protein assembly factor BamE